MERQTEQKEHQSLREKIETWSALHAEDYPPEVRKIFAEKTEEVLKSDILSKTPPAGDLAPDFTLPTSTGTLVNLREMTKYGPVILNFYRGTWCPYCNIEFESLLASMPQFRSHQASVLAVSPQVLDRNSEPVEADFLDLCDQGNKVAGKFGLVYPLGDKIKAVFQQFGILLEELNQDAAYEVPVPATYVIDKEMRIRYARAEADIMERAEPREILSCLQTIYNQ